MKRDNPCVRAYGGGPFNRTCSTCTHLIVLEYANRYFKCDKRKISSSSATDHRKYWAACARYEESKDKIR